MFGTKKYGLVIILLLLATGALADKLVVKSPVRFLALGDSYTIGQGVAEKDRWPNQLMESLKGVGMETEELTIIAQTGWTTKNLLDAIKSRNPDSNYNLVSLLIGVNNQYQGQDIEKYPVEFRELLETALTLCQGRKEGVMVLSIPDYGYTPFGSSNQTAISAEIDEYNRINRNITAEMGIAYFDITPISRRVVSNPNYLASDNLHPSGVMYSKWVELILNSSNVELVTSGKFAGEQSHEELVYPNPAGSMLTFRLPQNANLIEIYDGRGMEIYQTEINSGEDIKLNVSNWESGIYLYRITVSGKTQKTGKLVKK